MGFAAVILAGGSSSRMAPVNKLLAPLGDRAVIRHVVETALDVGLDPAVVVVGPDREALCAALAGLPAGLVGNAGHEEGLASSIRAGVVGIPAEVEGVVFLLGDMPLIAPEHVRLLWAAFDPDSGRSICIPEYRGQRGNPVLWGARHFPRLLQLRGDQGARVLFGDLAGEVIEVEMPDDAVLVDIDTGAALDAVRIRYANIDKRRRFSWSH